MLPFDPPEMARYGWSLTGLRLLALRRAQTKSFRAAAGVIFLTEYARRQVLSAIGAVRGRTAVIPHGVSSVFSQLPRQARQRYTDEAPFQLAYTSIVDLYKHQWMVVDAISMLRSKGIPISLILAGPAYKPALRRLRKAMSEAPSEPGIVKYIGAATTAELTAIYSAADSFAFASSCENMPNILLEGMASGLPIMCSNRSSMPEVLGDCGIYFDPESASSIADAARQLFESPQLRARLSQASYERSKLFSWNRCARETFRFISDVVAKTES
jgi:glycosyltransferase involved in cell wall biosynthesis